MRDTLRRTGVRETDFIRACDAAFKQGSKFVHWREQVDVGHEDHVAINLGHDLGVRVDVVERGVPGAEPILRADVELGRQARGGGKVFMQMGQDVGMRGEEVVAELVHFSDSMCSVAGWARWEGLMGRRDGADAAGGALSRSALQAAGCRSDPMHRVA